MSNRTKGTRFPRLTLAMALLSLAFGCQSRENGPRMEEKEQIVEHPNVLLIVIDTLGVGHVGAYQEGLDTTPHIDRLAEGATLFRNASSTAPWTAPATASIHSGLYPSRHGVLRFGDEIRSPGTLLAARFQDDGYRTGAVVGNPLVSAAAGFAEGYDQFEIFRDSPNSQKISDRALEFLGEGGQEPFFLYLHYMDPHDPYEHHQEFDRTSSFQGPPLADPRLHVSQARLTSSQVQHLVELHREEVAFTDSQIGRVLDRLAAIESAQETLILVTADHGEEFMNHGEIGHGRTLYQELIQVPLIVRVPGQKEPQEISSAVSLVDLYPTLLQLAGIAEPPLSEPAFSVDGTSLVPLLHSNTETPAQRDLFADTVWGEVVPIVSDLPQPDPKKAPTGFMQAEEQPVSASYKTSLLNGNVKLVHDQLNGWWEVYDLEQDPLERHNLFGSHPMEQALKERLLSWEANVGATAEYRLRVPEKIELGVEEIDDLRALGYVQ